MARVSVQQPLPLIKTKAKDARKVSFVLVVVYEDLLNWVKKLVFSTSLWVWVWAKGKSTCLLCDFVNNTFWPRGSEGKKSSPQDRCPFQNLKMFIFQHNLDFHILLHCVFRIGMNVAQKWEEKATQWDGPIKIILLSPPKIPALPLPYETTKCFDIQIKICLIATNPISSLR